MRVTVGKPLLYSFEKNKEKMQMKVSAKELHGQSGKTPLTDPAVQSKTQSQNQNQNHDTGAAINLDSNTCRLALSKERVLIYMYERTFRFCVVPSLQLSCLAAFKCYLYHSKDIHPWRTSKVLGHEVASLQNQLGLAALSVTTGSFLNNQPLEIAYFL